MCSPQSLPLPFPDNAPTAKRHQAGLKREALKGALEEQTKNKSPGAEVIGYYDERLRREVALANPWRDKSQLSRLIRGTMLVRSTIRSLMAT